MAEEKSSNKSILQAKITRLAIQITYIGELILEDEMFSN